MQNIEQKNISEESKDLHDLSGLEKTTQGIDISKKMEGLLWKTEQNSDAVSEEYDDKVLSIAQERFWFLIENNSEAEKDFIAMLDESLQVA